MDKKINVKWLFFIYSSNYLTRLIHIITLRSHKTQGIKLFRLDRPNETIRFRFLDPYLHPCRMLVDRSLLEKRLNIDGST